MTIPEANAASSGRKRDRLRAAGLQGVSAVLLVLALAYYSKGIYYLVLADRGAGDVRARWTEQQYFLQGRNPFDVWLAHAERAKRSGYARVHPTRDCTVDPTLGVKDPAHPPWGYVTGLFLAWVPWPMLRGYYLVLNLAASAVVGTWAYRLGAEKGRRYGILLAAGSLAIGGLCTTLEVGQYGLVVNALLVLTLMWQHRLAGVPAGLMLGFAQIKPTCAGTFWLAAALRRRPTIALVAALDMGASSLIVWYVTKTNPLEMLRQLFLMGSVLGTDGTMGLTHSLIDLGFDRRVATLAGVALVMVPAVAIMFRQRHNDLLTGFATAAVAGRLWTYHRPYDNVMLVFLLVALAKAAMDSSRPRWGWLGFWLVGISIWVPVSVSNLSLFQVYQHVAWVGGVVLLMILNLDEKKGISPIIPPCPDS